MKYRFVLHDPIPLQNIEDYRRAARRKLPEMIWAFVESAASDRISYTENAEAFAQWRLRQRVLAGLTAPQLATTMAGVEVSLPVALAPTGLNGLCHWQGDVAVARAAEAAGTRLALSTGSSYTLEEVADATEHHHWFQLYPFGDKEYVAKLLGRVAAAGYTALFVCVDVPVLGNREGERRAGLTVPPTLTPGRILDAVQHPRWLFNMLRHGRTVPVNYPSASPGAAAASKTVASTPPRSMQADLNWQDMQWIREQWKGPLYIKGIMDAEDAVIAIDRIGADGIVISNHGGRQLDRVPATLNVLPSIVEKIGGRGEIYLDGGVRRGEDVVIALCLGAQGVFIGRPYLYGLAAAGESGVLDVLSILRADIKRTLVMMGCPSVQELNPSWLIGTDSHRAATMQ